MRAFYIGNSSPIGCVQAINIFGDKRNRETAEKLAKERELQKINVKKEDIDLIVSVYRRLYE